MSIITNLKACAAFAALSVASTAWADGYAQAPMLDGSVSDGTLASVDNRLPTNPLVVEAPEIGNYGGVWRSALKGTTDQGWLRRTVRYDPLVSYSFDWGSVQPNIAASWTVNDDATVYTFKLRDGHKWSDGQPFTAEDIVFAVNDVVNHPDFTGSRPQFLLGATASAPDAQTLVIELPTSNGLFLDQIASVDGSALVQFQKGFCSQFHPDYNAQANDTAISEGLPGWGEKMRLVCDVQGGPSADRPTLYAWIQKTDYDGLNTPIKFERNPYYFKVDQEGHQLPYLDGLSMTQVEDANSIVLMGVAGEIDFMNRHIDLVENKPVFFDAQESGDYRLYSTSPSEMNTAIMQLNLNYEDDGFRDLFQTRDFRVALSHAIDREEVIDAIYAGQGEPWQAAPRPGSPFYDEEMAKQHTEFDPDKADEMLDALGLNERNDDGIRLLPDGRPVSIQLYVSTDLGPLLNMMELIDAHWADVGIDLDLRRSERSFVYELKDKGDHMMHVWKGDGGLGDAILDPRYYMPFSFESSFAVHWAKKWYLPDSPDAQEPPASVQRQHELYAQMIANPDPQERQALFAEILDIAKDDFFVFGVSLPPASFGIARNNMGNVPEGQPHAWIYPNPGPMQTSILFKRP